MEIVELKMVISDMKFYQMGLTVNQTLQKEKKNQYTWKQVNINDPN